MLQVKVFGVEWDEADDLETDIVIEVDDTKIEDKNDVDELEELISDGLSDTTGFCHLGWKHYKVLQ